LYLYFDFNPNDSITLCNKGLSLDGLGKYDEAIKWYDKDLAINPNNVDALNNKAVALYKLGKYDEDIKWYDEALAIKQ
jgi:tetratricopeptide (TPR) repeat protein